MVKGLPDASRVVFDDERAVANAGVMLPAVRADRLGIEALIDQVVDLGERPGAANPGRKVMTLLSAMMLGADCIDDCEVLRSGQTSTVLGHAIAAPSVSTRDEQPPPPEPAASSQAVLRRPHHLRRSVVSPPTSPSSMAVITIQRVRQHLHRNAALLVVCAELGAPLRTRPKLTRTR